MKRSLELGKAETRKAREAETIRIRQDRNYKEGSKLDDGLNEGEGETLKRSLELGKVETSKE